MNFRRGWVPRPAWARKMLVGRFSIIDNLASRCAIATYRDFICRRGILPRPPRRTILRRRWVPRPAWARKMLVGRFSIIDNLTSRCAIATYRDFICRRGILPRPPRRTILRRRWVPRPASARKILVGRFSIIDNLTCVEM